MFPFHFSAALCLCFGSTGHQNRDAQGRPPPVCLKFTCVLARSDIAVRATKAVCDQMRLTPPPSGYLYYSNNRDPLPSHDLYPGGLYFSTKQKPLRGDNSKRFTACASSTAQERVSDLEMAPRAILCRHETRHIPGRPLAHRSCLVGCRAGVTTAWDAACVGGRHRDCVRESTERCDFHCASYRNQFPKPTIFNQCLRSCMDVVETTCLKSREAFAAVEVPGEASTVARKPGRR